MSGFFDTWKENRRRAAEVRNRGRFPRFSKSFDLIALSGIVVLIIMYFMSSIDQSQEQVDTPHDNPSVVANIEDGNTHTEDTQVTEMKSLNIFKYFHVGIIELVLIVVISGFLIYIKYYKYRIKDDE